MRIAILLAGALALGGCSSTGPGVEERWTGHVLNVTSPAFLADAPMPKQHAQKGEGDNLSPLLTWSNVPSDTEEFAVICEDRDASGGTQVHWVAWALTKESKGLPAGVPAGQKELAWPAGARQGENSFGDIGYSGPLPSKGDKAHRYRFIVYALKARLSLDAGASAAELREAMQGLVIGRGELVGTYQR